MAIISKIGRRSVKTRLLIYAIYMMLIAGSVTMLFPFGLMIAGSSKSGTDKAEFRLIPEFLTNDRALWAKHVEGLFNESSLAMRQTYPGDNGVFETLELPERPNTALVEAWRTFLDETKPSHYTYTIGYVHSPTSRGTQPKVMREFRAELNRRFDGDIARLNREFGTEFISWSVFVPRREDYLQRRFKQLDSPFATAMREFKSRQPLGNRFYFSIDGFYRTHLKTQYRGQDATEPPIAEYNRTHGTSYASYDQVHMDRVLPSGEGRTDAERRDWEGFARTLLNLLWIRADDSTAPRYRQFLEAKYGDIEKLNRNYHTQYANFGQIPLIKEPPSFGLALSDWEAFLQGWKDPTSGEMYILPADKIRIRGIEFMFRDHLRDKYGDIEKFNRAMGTSYTKWEDVMPPQRDTHFLAFQNQKGALRWEFVIRNFITVFDYLVMHGRGVLNTAIYCVLAVFGALLVNPLAAYALSRFKLPSAYKILLFLMLTMSFPPVVTQIPSFLMLREFNMLNTFWALILPGLANGYSIFLLKGFFDSLPKELYESAALDGASEVRIFWQITMSLSKPILAVIALSAFNMAYSNFMFALLICQDRKMWTLMVWMYNLQQSSSAGVIYASLLVAAIPTFLVFAFCQKIIMRGIVVPVEK